MKKKYLFHY